MQEITLFEWLPALGIAPEEVYFWTPKTAALQNTSAISTEFSITYRWGHTAVPEAVGTYPVVSLFGGEAFFDVDSAAGAAAPHAANAKLDSLLAAFAASPMAAMDGRMSDVLRNTLFGTRGIDLASFNIFRARDLGVPSYSALAKCYGVTPHEQVRHYVCVPRRHHARMCGDPTSCCPPSERTAAGRRRAAASVVCAQQWCGVRRWRQTTPLSAQCKSRRCTARPLARCCGAS